MPLWLLGKGQMYSAHWFWTKIIYSVLMSCALFFNDEDDSNDHMENTEGNHW